MEAFIHIQQRVDSRKRRATDICMSNIRSSHVSLLWDAQLSAWMPSLILFFFFSNGELDSTLF